MDWDRSAVVQLARIHWVAAWSNSEFVHRHLRSAAETHPLGDRELLIHAVTQAGVLVGAAALELELCALTLMVRIVIYTAAMDFTLVSMVDS